MKKRWYPLIIAIIFIGIVCFCLFYPWETVPKELVDIPKAEENSLVDYPLYQNLDVSTLENEISAIQEKEVIVMNFSNEMSQESLEILRKFGILYPDLEKEQMDGELLIYRKNSLLHSGFMEKSLNLERRKQTIDQFVRVVSEFMDKTGYVFTLENGGKTIGTYTVMKDIYDCYTEETTEEEKVGSYCSIYVVQKILDEDQNHDYYTLTCFQQVKPYIGSSYLTNYFATGVSPYQEDAILIDSKPHISGQLEKDQAYFISLNPLLETGFRWTGRTGTQISATAYDNMYTIRFHDKKGIYGVDGTIDFSFYVFYRVPNKSGLHFQYNHHLCNATYRRGRDPHYYGGEWHSLIVPSE